MLDDRDIIDRCQRGQTESFEILIDRHRIALYSLCCKLTGRRDVADDLFQDTWVRAMRSIGRFSLDRKFTTWLFAICVNRYRDRYRWHQRWRRQIKQYWSSESKEREMESVAAAQLAPDEQFARTETARAVNDALAGLDDRFRLPLTLHYFRELDLASIAEIMNIPVGTVKSRLATGRARLARVLEGEGDA